MAAGLWVVAFKWQITFTLGAVLDGLIMALFTLIPVVLIRSGLARMLRPGKRGWWSRFWWKVMEWKVFRLAQRGRTPASIPASEPTEAVPDARERLGSTLGTLEQLRLDLLQLRTGASPGDLTGDLDAARRVSERIAALLAAREELE